MVKIPVPMSALTAAAAKRPVSLASESPPSDAPAADPPGVIAEAGGKIAEAYRQYDNLRALTSQLNGLAESSPLPEHVEIDSVIFHFRVNGEKKTATARTVQRVGDVYRLLALETERLVRDIRSEALRAKDAATTVEDACSRSQYVANARQSPQMP